MEVKSIFSSKTKYDSLGGELLREYNKHRALLEPKYSCYAPFKSIYFGHHGRAIACCYNRNYILGEYPKQSIREIWFGDAANKLRDYIQHNDFSLGCLSCKEQIVSGNFDAVKAKQYDERTLNASNFPSVMEFELSNVCNLECAMCSGDFSSLIRAKREKLPPIPVYYDSSFVKQLEEFIPHLDEVKFYGGEPFLIDIYYEIWDLIARVNPKVRISVQTNATVLNTRIKDLLKNTNFHMNISFDSLEKENYESIRVNAEFERTMENMKWYREYTRERDTFFGVSVCAMRQNWRELPQFINFSNEWNAPVYFHTVFYPLSHSIRSMNREELKEIKDYLMQFDFPHENAVQKKNRTHYFDFVSQVNAWYEKFTEQVTEKGKSSMEFSEVKRRVIELVEKDSKLSPDTKREKVKNLTDKFAEIEKQISPEVLKKSLEKINPNDPSFFQNVATYVDKLPVSALLTMTDGAFKE